MFANDCHFHPSLVFVGKGGGYQSGAPYGPQLKCLAPNLAPKYYVRVEVTDIGKHSSLLQFYSRKMFYRTGACTIKLYGFIIYEKWPNFAAS